MEFSCKDDIFNFVLSVCSLLELVPWQELGKLYILPCCFATRIDSGEQMFICAVFLEVLTPASLGTCFGPKREDC
jgi:hypothetical protein